jgi:hypothetical protein
MRSLGENLTSSVWGHVYSLNHVLLLNIQSTLLKLLLLPVALVAYTCNPSYSGGRDQEDHELKPAWANSSRLYLENTHHKKGWWSG